METLKEYGKEVLEVAPEELERIIESKNYKTSQQIKSIMEITGLNEMAAIEIILKETYNIDTWEIDRELERMRENLEREISKTKLKKRMESRGLRVIK